MNYKRKTLLLILIATAVRSFVAITTELGNDEVYYRLYASHLQWNYFDHPPVVGWLIRLTTLNLFLDNGFFIRFGAILSSAAATWLLFLSGKKLKNEYTGFLSAILYTATIYGSIIAGTFILPDSPQMVCWMAGLYLLISITASTEPHRNNQKKVLLFGIIAGVGMLCKIHTVFLWFGFLLYILFFNRKWLQQPVLYVSGLLSALLFYPVIAWNIDNHFVTFFYHSQRVNIVDQGIDLSGFLNFAGGQVLYINPIIFIIIVNAVVAVINNRLLIAPSQKRILLFTGFPLIVTATVISFFKQVLPHWTGPAYSSLLLLTALYYADKAPKSSGKTKLLPTSIRYAVATLVVIIVAGLLCINFIPGSIGSRDDLQKGAGDFTLDMYGWKRFALSFDSIYHINNSGLHKASETVIVSDKWFPAAHLEYYVARPLQLKVLALGSLEDIHQFQWWNKDQPPINDSVSVYVIIPSNYYFDISQFAVFKNKTPVVYYISQERNGKVARNFTIYYFKKDHYTLND